MGSGDSTKKEPVVQAARDRRLPVAGVGFIGPALVPGFPLPVTSLKDGEDKMMDGRNIACPKMWFDPDHRTIVIEGRHFPIERIQYFDQARFSPKTKEAGPMPDHTIGKRA